MFLQCAILSPIFRVRDFSITDCQPYAIQLSWQGTIDEDRYVFIIGTHLNFIVPNLLEILSQVSKEICFENEKFILLHSTMEVFSKFHQIPFSKMLTFYRTDPFVLEASYIGKDIPHSNTNIGTSLFYLLGL